VGQTGSLRAGCQPAPPAVRFVPWHRLEPVIFNLLTRFPHFVSYGRGGTGIFAGRLLSSSNNSTPVGATLSSTRTNGSPLIEVRFVIRSFESLASIFQARECMQTQPNDQDEFECTGGDFVSECTQPLKFGFFRKRGAGLSSLLSRDSSRLFIGGVERRPLQFASFFPPLGRPVAGCFFRESRVPKMRKVQPNGPKDPYFTSDSKREPKRGTG